MLAREAAENVLETPPPQEVTGSPLKPTAETGVLGGSLPAAFEHCWPCIQSIS